MKKIHFFLFISCFLCSTSIQSQISEKVGKVEEKASVKSEVLTRGAIRDDLLKSGPMLGYSQMREVLIWVQTTEAAEVQIQYAASEPTLDSLFVNTRKIVRYSETVRTNAGDEFVAKIILKNLAPGWKYTYELYIDGKKVSRPYPLEFQTQALWQWRTDPPAFTMAVGSCAYINDKRYDRPSKPYGGDYFIFNSIHKKRPDAMLWLGDNIYLREADWNSKSGIMHRYTHARSLPEMQALLASTHHYAIWDDHDFGPNNSDRSFIHKDKTLHAFNLFWGNPTAAIPNQEGGITTQFQWQDVDFFLLDNRSFKTPNNCKSCDKVLLGQAQIDWVIEAMTASYAPFKMIAIGGQVLNPVEQFETYSNLNKEERDYLLKRIEEEGLKNVIFLTGDVHRTELSEYKNAAGNMVYDLTVSPLTSGAHSPKGVNTLLVEGTMIDKRNFGILTFSGPRKARTLKMTVYDGKGAELWSKTIQAAVNE